jgi:hypothetical protein
MRAFLGGAPFKSIESEPIEPPAADLNRHKNAMV